MQIELSDSGCLTLLISDEELAVLGLTFDELDYETPKTRRIIRGLLQMASNETGFFSEGALLVEALPLESGCLLLVTPDDGELCDDTACSPTAFFVGSDDALLQIAAAWRKGDHPFGESSSLYRAGRGYWLILYGGNVPSVVYECADRVLEGETAAASAAEHGIPLFIGDALPRLQRSR